MADDVNIVDDGTRYGEEGDPVDARPSSSPSTQYGTQGDYESTRERLYGDNENLDQDLKIAWSKAGMERGTGMTFQEYADGQIWAATLESRGLGDRRTRDKYDELRGLRDRDSGRFWENKSDWQSDLEEKMRSGVKNISSKMGYGGGGMYARRSLQKAIQQSESSMIDKIVQGRVEESRQAGLALDGFLDAAAQSGESAVLASTNLMAQWKMNKASLEQADRAANMALFGTILSGAILVAQMSDENLKTVTGDTQGAAYDYLDKMETAQYNMPVRQLIGQDPNEMGVMAQSLERSDMGQQAVGEAGGMKTIETVQGLRSTMVAQNRKLVSRNLKLLF